MAISAVNEIHPDGDTLFILRHPDAPFATVELEEQWLNALPSYQTEGSKMNEALLLTKRHEAVEKHSSLVQANSQSSQLRFGLNSALLIDTSSYFKKSLSKEWNTPDPESGYKWTLEGRDWDGEAFLLLMNILHNKARAVPRKIGLEMFAKVAVLVDYYGCHEVVELWAEVWSSSSDVTLVNPFYSRDLLFQLTISLVFRKRQMLQDVIRVAIRTSRGPIHTLDLPIPKLVVDAIEEVRLSSIGRLILGIEQRWESLNRHGVGTYGRSCLYMQLGYMDQNLSQIGLKPLPSKPYYGYSLDALEVAIDSFDNSVKCSCWSQNHLQDRKLEFRRMLDDVLSVENSFRISESDI